MLNNFVHNWFHLEKWLASPITTYQYLPFVCVIGGTFRKKTEEQAPWVKRAHRPAVLGAGAVHGADVPASEEDVLVELG